MTGKISTVKVLGEIALRVRDLDAMQNFYQDVVGLELMHRSEKIAFFRIADGFAGHTQILALFDRSGQDGYSAPWASRTSVDHIAFTIALEDYDVEKARLESLGLEVTTATHTWVHWRSLYFFDPEGNELEFVCYDASV
jgi:catechol 2,3-dioxygenase